MNTLKTEKLYILSAPPGFGKSSFLKFLNVPTDWIVSSDEMRSRFFGALQYRDQDGSYIDPRDVADQACFEFIMSVVENRMKNRMTTFIDATNVRESDRNAYAELAKKYQMPTEVLFLKKDLEQAIKDNFSREKPVPVSHIQRMFSLWSKEGYLPSREVDPYEKYSIEDVRVIPADVQVDAIGDVHGLLEPMDRLLEKLGYDTSKPGLPHPEGRKLLFLGDMVDRGPDSIKVLQKVMLATKAGHYAIRGNHEQKLLQFVHAYNNGQLKKWSSIASAETGYKLLSLDREKKEELLKFLNALPGHYYQGNTLFAHADIGFEFDPMNVGLHDFMYGESTLQEKKDSDAIFTTSNSKYSLVRGHIPSTSATESVKVVYEKGEYGGELAALRLPSMSEKSPEETRRILSETPLILEKTGFDYDLIRSKRSQLSKDLASLVKKGLATVNIDEKTGLQLYKYAKTVFFNNSWHESYALNRARGIVLNLAGEIVQNPFTKVFNFGENGTTMDDSQSVVAPEKINGFMGSVSLHPCNPSSLLVTTTGSFNSEFVGYIHELIHKAKLTSPMMALLKKSEPLTLLFEVVHPKDPHIVNYSEKEQGLYLIGARGLGGNDLEYTEERLDEIAEFINLRGGKLFRPKWHRMSFKEAKEWVKSANNHEGLMIREDTPEQKIAMKIKSPWYLTTKFIGRMGDSKIKHMFSAPNDFKKRVDEEFFPIVDAITERSNIDTFSAMSTEERIHMVREIIEEQRASKRSFKP